MSKKVFFFIKFALFTEFAEFKKFANSTFYFLVEQIQRDYNVLYEQYCKSRTEVTMLKDKNKSLNATFEEIKNERQQFIPISLHNSSVNECKRYVFICNNFTNFNQAKKTVN